MLERILVPVDGSPESEGVLDRVKGLLGRRKASLTLLQARAAFKGERAQAGSSLEALAAAHREERLTVRARVVDGYLADAILRTAQEEHASMIALPVRLRRGLLRRSLGRAPLRVLHGASVPVLLLQTPSREGGIVPRRILFPVDGSERGEGAAPAVIELARPWGAEVRMIHVVSPPGLPVGYAAVDPSPPPRAADVLGPMAGVLDRAGVDVRPRMLKGDPVSVILEEAASADLVVMTTRGHSGIFRWMSERVIEKVTRRSPTPLLVVPTRAASAAAVA